MSPSKNDWNRIRVTGSSASLSFQNTKIEGAVDGIRFENGGSGLISTCTLRTNSTGIYCSLSDTIKITINNCYFNNNNYGIYTYNSATEITNCTIDGSSYGIRSYYGYSQNWTPDFKDNVIKNSTAYGIYLYNSSPTLSGNLILSNHQGIVQFYDCNSVYYDNTISNSTYYGMACYAGPDPILRQDANGQSGHNKIIYNGQYGIKVSGNSKPELGNLNMSNGGINSIHSNTSYEIFNYGSASINAMQNWWDNPSGPLSSEIYGNVATYPHLTEDPEGGDPYSASSMQTNITADIGLPAEITAALEQETKGNYNAAAGLFKQFILEHKGSKFSSYAAAHYVKSILSYLKHDEAITQFEVLLAEKLDDESSYELLAAQSNCYVRINQSEKRLTN